MVCTDGAYVDVISCGAPSGHYQLLFAQSLDTGATWSTTNMDLSNETAHTYFLPHMTRYGCDLHVVSNSNGGAKYFHSGDGGTTWDTAFAMTGGNFIAYTGHVLHVVNINSNHNVSYTRNTTGNAGLPCFPTETKELSNQSQNISIYPNPATNLLNVSLANKNQNVIINFYNIYGQLIINNGQLYRLNRYDNKATTMSNSSGISIAIPIQSVQLSIDKLPCGVYFLEVIANGERTVKKVIKMN
jgi:hypothetical protein